jgi:hypothetical protein
VAYQIDRATDQYYEVAGQVELGDRKEDVLAVLSPTQSNLPRKNQKPSEKYMKDGVRVEIYYMRSGRQPDGLTTDDEFVPYLFNDDKLVAIGWQALGGPSSQGQATSDVNVSTTTIIY